MVEHAFGLHSATITALFRHRGVFASFVEKQLESDEIRRIHIVVKAAQKFEIGNYLLSLSYDVATGWINALVCGYGMVHEREEDAFFGFQLEQLIDAIVASPTQWNNILFVPYVALQIYLQRVEMFGDLRDVDMMELEEKLGVTRVGGTLLRTKRSDWLEAIDPKEMTVGLHSVLIRVGFMTTCCEWLKAYAQFLIGLDRTTQADRAFQKHATTSLELRESITALISVITGEGYHFSNLRDRATSQVNLLFSVVSQQDGILNRRESRLNQVIAASSKQDSISVTTFTFITALFLPGTFIATLFSMTMFDWYPETDDASSSPQETSVSSKFWLFWAISIPLTVLTMSGWFLWFKYADSKWNKELSKASDNEEDDPFYQPRKNPRITQGLINHPGLTPGYRLPLCQLGFGRLNEPDLQGAISFCPCVPCSAALKTLYDKASIGTKIQVYGQGRGRVSCL